MAMRQREHFVLNARNGRTAARGWQAVAPIDPSISFEDERLSLRRVPGTGQALADRWGTFGGLAHPTGLAVDEDNRIYILETEPGRVKRFDPCRCEFEVLSCIGGTGEDPRQLRDPRGLAISPAGDLVIADTGNRRLQVFSVKDLVLRFIIGPLRVIRAGGDIRVERISPARKPAADCGIEFEFAAGTWLPHDVVFSGGRLYVSDTENGLVHIFDCQYRWQTAVDGKGEGQPALERPTHLAKDRRGRVYVVQDGKSSVIVLDADGEFVERVETTDAITDEFSPGAISADADGNLFVNDRCGAFLRACYCDDSGAVRSIGRCQAQTHAAALMFDRAGNLLLCDAAGGRVLTSSLEGTFAESGTIYCGPLDSSSYRCVWDRIEIRGVIAPGTQVTVRTITSDIPQTADAIGLIPDERWGTNQSMGRVGTEAWDCLVSSPPGRYLWLRFDFSGEKTATPSIGEVRVYFPRASSLRYLPATYSEDAVSRDFLDRFLSIFDSIQRRTSRLIGDLASYFNAMSVPAGTALRGTDFLSWLASWLDLPLDQHWSLDKRRRLLKNAHRLYALRGTPEGLRLHIQLYTGSEPRILEHFKLRRWLFLNYGRLGDQARVWGDAIVRRLQLDGYAQIGSFQLIDSGDPVSDPYGHQAHQFTVSVPLGCASDRDLQRRTLERIIEMAKPAHTQGFLHLVQPRFRLGVQSFVGIDTVVGEYPSGVTLDGEEKIGVDSVLGPSADEARPPHLRVGVRSRIGSSTRID